MKRIPKSFIDELGVRTDLVALIGSRVTLKRKSGNNHWACCPFHHEKTPSFKVDGQKGLFYCFGCGISGDSIRFLMEYENLAFTEAVEYLAEYNGLNVPYEEDGSFSDVKARDKHALGLQCLADAASFFHRMLYEENAGAARAYLRKRHLRKPTVEQFQLGYAPGGNALLKHLGSQYTHQLLMDVGLLGEKEGHIFDWFRDRIIFPIHNVKGQVIAFGARSMGDSQPKYLNSPESEWFNKRFEFYGLHHALQIAGRNKTLIVTEGYMDVIALWQHGINNAVAALGTAISDTHIGQLQKRAEKIYFSFDGDSAGRKAAKKALEVVFNRYDAKHEWRFVFMPEGQDPDSLLENSGIDAFRACIDAALPASGFLLDVLDDGEGEKRTAESQAALAVQAQQWLSFVPDKDYREFLRVQIMRHFNLPVLTITEQESRKGHYSNREKTEEILPPPVKIKNKAIQLMACIWLQPQYSLALRPWEYPQDESFDVFWRLCYTLQSCGATREYTEAFLHDYDLLDSVKSASLLLSHLNKQQLEAEFSAILTYIQQSHAAKMAKLEKFAITSI